MEELWKIVDGYPLYQVSNLGRIFNTKTNRIYEPAIDSHGYRSIALKNESGYKQFYVHRLVAFAFIDGYFDGAFVNHKDGVKHNNHVENLEWVTHTQNMRHIHETGLYYGRKGKVVEVYYPHEPLEPW